MSTTWVKISGLCDRCDVHKPLLPSQKRLAYVGSAQGDDGPGISLQVVHLYDPVTGDSRQQYTVFSFVWGDVSSDDTLPICRASGGLHGVKVSH